ncbi:hypothetical protein IV102_09050 [bacterium]|nr:hypothetical protein [bacterium]
MSWPKVIGVRHHSPACARLVEQVISEETPDWVLIEGPSDYNDQISELALKHYLPVALFSSRAGVNRCYTPFCDYSPEWVALTQALTAGAQVRFMDLPAWHDAMHDLPNRYRDHPGISQERLARRLGYDGSDALWDALFEQKVCARELRRYFQELRGGFEVTAQDQKREAFMAQCIAWAHGQGKVLAICGGFHAPLLEEAWHDYPADWPTLEAASEASTCLVPFSFGRLDSFRGYAAGMPSPLYYQRVWESGLEQAARHGLKDVAVRLRQRRQSVSSADLVAAWSNAMVLQRLRGHHQVLRTDLLDGLVGALVKEALEAPLPWSYRGTLAVDTDPVVAAMVAALSGDRRGKLHPDTRRPPLLQDVSQQLTQLDLLPSHPARQVTCAEGTPRSYLLHRLRILAVPGFRQMEETVWGLAEDQEFEAALIEASAYGSTLEEATLAVLEHKLEPDSGAAKVAFVLSEASLAGFLAFRPVWLARLATALAVESQLSELCPALSFLTKAHGLNDLLQVAVERALCLLERAQSDLPEGVPILQTLRQLVLRQRTERGPVVEVLHRLAHSVAWELRGAAVGLLWALHEGDCPALQVTPDKLGDYLSGLFALAREQVVGRSELLDEIHRYIQDLDRSTFLGALPSLRMAFQRLSPQERQQVALHLLPVLGLQAPRELLRTNIDGHWVILALQLGEMIEAEVARYGL